MVTNKNKDYRIIKLHPFYFDPTKYDPTLIANKNLQMVVVENILDMRGNHPHGSKKQLCFLGKWKDVDSRENTWKLYSNLRDNENLDRFLTLNKLEKLIPKKFKT